MISPALFSNNNFSGSGDIAINFADDKKDYCVIDNLYKAINITAQDVVQNGTVLFSNQTEPNQTFNGRTRVKSVIKKFNLKRKKSSINIRPAQSISIHKFFV